MLQFGWYKIGENLDANEWWFKRWWKGFGESMHLDEQETVRELIMRANAVMQYLGNRPTPASQWSHPSIEMMKNDDAVISSLESCAKVYTGVI